MENAKHTPGPWRRDGRMIYSYKNDYFRVVAEVFDGEDDAFLIAAAPELLGIVERLVDQGLSTSLVNDARVAIAKAAGGSQ